MCILGTNSWVQWTCLVVVVDKARPVEGLHGGLKAEHGLCSNVLL